MKVFVLSLFAGCGGASYGAKLLGFKTLGVEFRPDIAEIYRLNVGDCIVSDVRNIDPYRLPVPLISDRRNHNEILILQLSPPCQEDSTSNIKSDPFSERALVLKELFWHIDVLQPDAIFLENVSRYGSRNGVFKLYCDFLESRNYVYENIHNLNCADFGVPQKRVRLIHRAWKRYFGQLPPLKKTNSRNTVKGQLNLITAKTENLNDWVGWWDAVKPYVHTFKESSLTQNQIKAIKERGFLDDNGYLIDGKIYKDRSNTIKSKKEPSFTIISNHYNAMPKALLLQRVGYGSKRLPQVKSHKMPSFTIKSKFADDNQGATRSKFIDCLIPLKPKYENTEDLIANSQVLSLNDLAIAAIQTFPSSYQWSDNLKLNVEMIGNAVPVLLSYRVLESFRF